MSGNPPNPTQKKEPPSPEALPNNQPKLLRAGLSSIRTSASRLRIGLRHVLPGLRLAVVSRASAVVDVAGGVHPDHARSATRSSGLRSCRSRRTSLRCGCRRRSRCRLGRSSGCRSRSSGLCSSSRCSVCSRFRSSSRSSGLRRRSCVPGLNTLVSAASAALRRRHRVSAVLTNSSCACRGAGRSLCHRAACRNREQSSHYKIHRLHRSSSNTFNLENLQPRNPTANQIILSAGTNRSISLSLTGYPQTRCPRPSATGSPSISP